MRMVVVHLHAQRVMPALLVSLLLSSHSLSLALSLSLPRRLPLEPESAALGAALQAAAVHSGVPVGEYVQQHQPPIADKVGCCWLAHLPFPDAAATAVLSLIDVPWQHKVLHTTMLLTAPVSSPARMLPAGGAAQPGAQGGIPGGAAPPRGAR